MRGTDIIVTTYNRLPYFKRTLHAIFVRTKSPFQLYLIDDGSTEGNARFILDNAYRTNGIVLKADRRGISHNVLLASQLATTDIFVLTDDDVLCPDIDPDWLSRGLSLMEKYPNLAAMALNDSSCEFDDRRHVIDDSGDVVYCGRLGAQFLFLRRDIVVKYAPQIKYPKPICSLVELMRSGGYDVGYTKDIYCWHFGKTSARRGEDISMWIKDPADMRTLKPDFEGRP